MVEIGQIKLRLPTPEDLIIMKAIAHRPKDLMDIQSIAASVPDLDKRAHVRIWVEQFGEALDMPDLWETDFPIAVLTGRFLQTPYCS